MTLIYLGNMHDKRDIFRRLYETEIHKKELKVIETEIDQKLIQIQNRGNYEKGLLGEYRLMKQIERAVEQGAKLKDVVYNPQKNLTLGPISLIQKDRIYISHEKSAEADLFIRGVKGESSDFFIEVKNWNRKISLKQVEEFVEKVKLLKTKLKETGYILYSQKGFTENQITKLKKEKIMYTDAKKLIKF